MAGGDLQVGLIASDLKPGMALWCDEAKQSFDIATVWSWPGTIAVWFRDEARRPEYLRRSEQVIVEEMS